MEVSPRVGGQQKRFSKKVVAALLIGITLVSSIALIAATGAPEPAEADTIGPEPRLTGLEAKGWQFIKNVLAVDTAQYNASIRSINNPAMSTATVEQIAQAGSSTQYTLNSSTGTLQIIITFKKDQITWANLNPYSGEISYTRPPSSNLTEAAKSFLIAYQEFNGRNVTEWLETLNGLKLENGTTVTSGNLKLTVTHQDLTGTYFGDNYHFSWVNTYNGCDYKHLSLTFQDGRFGGFIDNYLVYPIGDTTVNVTAQQALQIGLDAAKAYSYDMGAGIIVSNFVISGTEVILSPQTRNDVLYPSYTVNLYFNGTYPGSVHGLTIYVWADTGEISLISKIAYSDPTDHY